MRKIWSSGLVWDTQGEELYSWEENQQWNFIFQILKLPPKTLEYPLDCKEVKPVNPKGNKSCIFIERTDAEAEAPILWSPDAKNWLIQKRPWCWEKLKAGKGDDKGWDGWMPSSTRWTWVWASSGSPWWTGKSAVLQCMGLQRIRHNWVNWTELHWDFPLIDYNNDQTSFPAMVLQKLIFHYYVLWSPQGP